MTFRYVPYVTTFRYVPYVMTFRYIPSVMSTESPPQQGNMRLRIHIEIIQNSNF